MNKHHRTNPSKPISKRVIFIVCGLLALLLTVVATFLIRGQSGNPKPNSALAATKESIKNNHPDLAGLTQYLDEKYPECPSTLSGLLTAPLEPMDEISSISPLGNLGPPFHTFPSDHQGLNNHKNNAINPRVAVFAPGNFMVSNLLVETREYASGEKDFTYAFTFVACRGVLITVALIDELTPEWEQKVTAQDGECKTFMKSSGNVGEAMITTTQCTYTVDYKTQAGEQIGWTGGGKYDSVIEVWAYNLWKEPDPNFAWSDVGYSLYPYSFCLFDMYSGDLYTQFQNKFGEFQLQVSKYDEVTGKTIFIGDNKLHPRLAEPRCGTVHQNIFGTAQGWWLPEGTNPTTDNPNPTTDNLGLALVHGNYDPSKAAISGGLYFDPYYRIDFSPEHSGLYNRDFSEVTADGYIYCYKGFWFSVDTPWRILIKLIDAHTLMAEHQVGACSGNLAFQNPVTYTR